MRFYSLPSSPAPRSVSQFLAVALLGGLLATLAGCGMGVATPSSLAGAQDHPFLTGSVHGGQQPVSGAAVYLYAISTSTNGGAAASLLNAPGYVTTDVNGGFSITGDYTCPAGAYVYLLAKGGNPGLAGVVSNNALALAAALGPCSALTPSTFVSVNEVTTVTAAYALASFATSETQVGAAGSNSFALGTAFALNGNLADVGRGAARTATPTGNGTVPQAKIDSLANSLAACVNSDGTGAPCAALMSAANVSSDDATPVDTFQAVLSIAHHPTLNVDTIYNMAPPASPFQPSLSSAPSDWIIGIQFPSSGVASLSPASATVAQGGQQGFIASLSGPSGGSSSYLWSTSGSFGMLNEVGGTGQVNQTSYCSTSAQANYTANSSPMLSGSATDTVTVQIFSGAGCAAGNSVSTSMASAVTVTPPTATLPVTGFPTTTQTATLVLPSGSSLTPDQLTILDSITQTTPAPSGTFTIPTYSFGPQIVLVQSPSGNPMLMGWMDATHSTVSAQSTAEVLAFYAMGGPLMYTENDQLALEAAILNASGLPALTQVVAQEIAANPDALLGTDANIQAAVNAFFASVSGITPQVARGRGAAMSAVARPNASGGGGGGGGGGLTPGIGISVSPSALQSGLLVEQASAPNTGDAMNTFRRRVHAFVERVSDTDTSSTVTADPADITDFEIPPTNGLTGGVTGAISDIYNAYWGNTATAYAPVTSNPFPIPLVSPYARTTYKVTIVGAGVNNATYSGLTDAQASAQLRVAVGGFVQDAMIPFLANFIFGSGFLTGPSGGAADALKSAWKDDLTNDLLNEVGQAPGLEDAIIQGDWRAGMSILFDNIRQSGVLRTVVFNSLESAANQGLSSSALTEAFDSFNIVLNATGGLLQIYDSSILATQLLQSNAADQWTIVNGGQKVTLTPAATTMNQVGVTVQNLTVALPGVTDPSNISYYYTNTANAGDIAPADNSQPASKGFCSSQSVITYVARSLPTLTQQVTDAIHASAYTGGNCVAANLLGNAPAATVTVTPPDQVTLTPLQSTIDYGSQVTLTAGYSGATPVVSYMWTDTATLGTLTDTGGTGATGLTSYCSTSNVATYVSTAPGPVTPPGSDTITVAAYSAANCPAANRIQTPTSAAIETASTKYLRVTPPHTLTNSGTNVALTASFATINTTGFSYQWITTGNAGSLSETGGGGRTSQTSYCSTSAQATYVSNTAVKITPPVADTVNVTAFKGAGCVSSNQVGLPGLAVITTQISPKTTPTPGELLGTIQASDGNFYGVAFSSPSTPATVLSVNAIYKVDANGNVTTLFDFTNQTSNPNYIYGYGVNPLIEGPDGQLYGSTYAQGSPNCDCGTFFKISLSGTITLLHAFTSADQFTTYMPAAGYPVGTVDSALIPASDGNFYGPALGGIYKITPTGTVTPLYGFPDMDGTGSDLNHQPGLSSALVQALDGNLYGTVGASDADWTQNDTPPSPNTVFRLGLGGAFSTVATFPEFPVYGLVTGPNAPLAAGPDGSLYGTTRGERPGLGACFLTRRPCVPVTAATVFRVGMDGGFSTIYTFNSLPDGTAPLTPLVVAQDGDLYGTASTGGEVDNCPVFAVVTGTAGADNSVIVNDPGCGTVFRITPAGSFTKLYSFQLGNDGTITDTGFPGPNAIQWNTVNESGLGLDSAGNLFGPSLSASGALLYSLPALPQGPVQLGFSAPAVSAGQPVALNWNVGNAFSLTMQQCYAFVQGGPTGAGAWTGKQTGVLDSTGYHGSTMVTPTLPGTYTYALTCGGVESGFGTLVVH
jgi:uncharacterized repeat protein (TIGR03803 family)